MVDGSNATPKTPSIAAKQEARAHNLRSANVRATRRQMAVCRSAGLGQTRLFHPWGREPDGGVRRLRSVSHVVRPSQGSGLMGWVGSRWVLSGYVRVPYGPV